MEYIQNHETSVQCVFCASIKEEDTLDNLIIARGQNVFAILNRFPYTSGHLMVVPYQHVSTLEDLDSETRAEIMEMVTHAISVVRKVYRAEAFNIGANIGAAAGAGIADHVHIHVVPRWVGDTNFMSSLGQIRVLPETLEDTYHRIRAAW